MLIVTRRHIVTELFAWNPELMFQYLLSNIPHIHMVKVWWLDINSTLYTVLICIFSFFCLVIV